MISNPNENTIWINTTTSISSWEISATEPVASSGKVWICMGTLSDIEFNALKENCIKVCLLYVKQYINNAWVNVDAMTYMGGEWVEFVVYLYNLGDLCETITGGFNYYTSSSTQPSYGEDYIEISGIYSLGNYFGWTSLLTKNTIDLTDISTIYCYGCASVGTNIQPLIGVATTQTPNLEGNDSAAVTYLTSSTVPTLYSLDVSSLVGSYYVGVGISGGKSVTSSASIKFWKLYMQ